MCFSPSASFTAATVLALSSVYALNKTRTSGKKTFYLIAIMPLLFAVQQFFEGFIWLSLKDVIDSSDTTLDTLSYIYLFFAYAFWPFWIPLAISIFDQKRRALFYSLTVLGFIFMASTIIHFVIHPNLIAARMLDQSICYLNSCVFRFHWSLIIYLALTVGSMLAATSNLLKILGCVIFFSAILAYFVYQQTFVSVWCFFSAVISLFICYISYRLDKEAKG